MSIGPAIEVLADPAAVARRAADFVAGKARAAVADHGQFSFAVSGGHTPWAMFAELADEEMPWAHCAFYQVDERVAPAGDPDRNLTHLLDSLTAEADGGVRAMPVERVMQRRLPALPPQSCNRVFLPRKTRFHQ